MEYVYEFTNQRKLTKAEFLKWFQKKVLYTIRKFRMIKNGDVVFYENKGDFREVVLEDVLKIFSEKANVKLISRHGSLPLSHKIGKLPAKKSKLIKRAISSTTDTESDKFVHNLINGDVKNIKQFSPVCGETIKPLYLFLDKEVLLYAKLKNLKFKTVKEKKNKISHFIDELEKKHPELKQAIIKSYLDLYY